MIFLKRFKKEKDLVHGILERKDGSVSPFWSKKAQQNLLKALERATNQRVGFSQVVMAEQVHSKKVHFSPKGVSGYLKFGADAIVTDEPGKVIIIKTADCVPVLLYHPFLKRIAVVHAGRREIIRGVIEKTFDFFKKDISHLLVGIGPHIRKCCYFLRGKTKSYKNHREWKKYTKEKKGKIYFDLTGAVKDKLLRLGVKKENIEDCNICTFCCFQRFFSYRKREKYPGVYKKEEIDGYTPCFASFLMMK